MLKRLFAVSILLLAPVGTSAQYFWYPAVDVLMTAEQCAQMFLHTSLPLPADVVSLKDVQSYYVIGDADQNSGSQRALALTQQELEAAFTNPSGNLLTEKFELAEATFRKLRLGRCLPSPDGSFDNWPPVIVTTRPSRTTDADAAVSLTAHARERNWNQTLVVAWVLSGPGTLEVEDSGVRRCGSTGDEFAACATYTPPTARADETSAVVTVTVTDPMGLSDTATFNITIPAANQ